MPQLRTTIDQQVPLSQVRAHYNEVVRQAKKQGYMLVVKNYIPHSVIMSPDFFFEQLSNNQTILDIKEKKRRAQAVNDLLKFRDKISPKIKSFDFLKQLIKDRTSH